MIKTVLTLTLLFALNCAVKAQNFCGQTTTSSTTNEAIDVEIDGSGSSYVAGYFSGGTSFAVGVPPIASQGANDIYVSKYNSNGGFQWAKSFGGQFSDKPTDLAIDNAGDIIVTGEYFGQITFGSTTLSSSGNSKDIFIVKLNSSGTVVWAKSEGGADSENAYGVTVDGSNNIILTGQFKGLSQIAGQTVNSLIDPTSGSVNFDLFIAKYTPAGVPIWLQTGQAKFEERGLAVACDASDNIFLTGQFSDTMVIAGTTVNNAALSVGFVAKFSSTGTMAWLNMMKAGFVVPYDIEINSANEPVIVGDFSGSMLYITSSGNTTINSPFSKKIFTLKISNAGLHIWNKVLGSDNELSARAVSIDATQNIYVTGHFRCNWTELHNGQTANYNSVGYRDAYLARIDNQGSLSFAKTFGSQLNDEGQGVAINNLQQAVICGTHTQILNIPITTSFGYSFFSGTGTSQIFSLYNAFTYPQNHMSLFGDLSANSFLTNAVHLNTPDYNYFIGTPTDSLDGFIEDPLIDTVHFCSSESLFYDPNTYVYNPTLYSPILYGPDYTYLWNTGSTTNPLSVSQSGTYSVIVERVDGCIVGYDTIVAILEPSPPIPLMSDNLGIAVNTTNYPTYNFCSPDSVTISFSNLCAGCSIFIGLVNITDTLPHVYNEGGYYPVGITNEYCITNSYFIIQLDSTVTHDSINPYLYFLEDTDHNDTITICADEWLNVHVYDSITNPNAIVGQFFSQPTTGYYFDVPATLSGYLLYQPPEDVNAIYYHPTTTGWHVFTYHAGLGYSNLCGSDVTNYLVTDSVYIIVNPLPLGNSNISSPSLLCPNDSVFLTVNPVYTGFIWQGPNITYTSPNNDSIQVTSAGNFTYSGLITDPITGCTDSVTNIFTLYEKQPPIIVMNPLDGIVCPGDSVDFWIPNTYASYNWVGPNGANLSNTNTYTDAQPGFYYCQVIDSNGCVLTTPAVEVNVYTLPTLYADPQPILCSLIPITLNVSYSDNAVINWINPSWAGSSSQISVILPGTYICQIQQCGITTIDTLIIADGSFSLPISVTDTVLCYGDTSVISVPSGYSSYLWSSGQTVGNSIAVTQSGQYSVSAINQYGCEAFSDTINVTTVPLSFPPNVPDTAICEGDNVVLINLDALPVNWFDPNFNLQYTGINFTFNNVLQDTVVYAAYNVLGCPPAYQEVNVIALHPFDGGLILGDTIVCPLDATQLSLNLSPGNVEWFIDGLYINYGDTFDYIGTAGPSVHEVMAVITNNCFSDTVFQNIYTLTSPVLNLFEDSVIICGTNVETIDAPNNFDSLSWTTPIGIVVSDYLDITSAFGNGTYVYAQGSDMMGCSSNIDSILVIVPSSPSVVVPVPTMLCLNDTVNLIATTNADSLVWSGPFGSFTGYQLSIELTNPLTTLTIVAYDSYGCSWLNSLVLNTGASPFTIPSDTILCFTEWLNQMNVSGELTWYNNNGVLLDTNSIIDNSWYAFTAVNSISGCSVTDSIYIVTVSCNNTFPNVITPNGDGINDYFVIDYALKQPNNQLIVLNRWGNVVFEMEAYDNTWDGNELHDGVYFYMYNSDTKKSNAKIVQGTIHLLR